MKEWLKWILYKVMHNMGSFTIMMKANDLFEKLSFYHKMKTWLSWHVPFEQDEVYCPNCRKMMKSNGEGFYRCSMGCDKEYIILIAV